MGIQAYLDPGLVTVQNQRYYPREHVHFVYFARPNANETLVLPGDARKGTPHKGDNYIVIIRFPYSPTYAILNRVPMPTIQPGKERARSYRKDHKDQQIWL
jgi:hypothetical protein